MSHNIRIYPECDGCINDEYDPFQCDSCVNGSNYEGEEQEEEISYEEFICLFGDRND